MPSTHNNNVKHLLKTNADNGVLSYKIHKQSDVMKQDVCKE